MTDEELRVRAIQELEFYKKDDTFMLADITVDLAIEALEQMPVTTTAEEGGVIYYPQVEGVTPTVIDAGKQERDAIDRKLVCAFIAGLISDDVEREKGLEYIRHMPPVNPQPCEDAIDRAEAIKIASGYCHPANVIKELAKLPPVTPQPKTGHWIYDRTRDWDGECKYECSECGMGSDVDYAYCMRCGAKMIEPQESEG